MDINMLNRFSFLAVSLLFISACSSDDDDSAPISMDADSDSVNADSNDSAAALLARGFINNGFYLSSLEYFGADGSSSDGISFTLNTDENTIEGRGLSDQSALELLYRYNDDGDLTSLTTFSADALLPATDEVISQLELIRVNGALQEGNLVFSFGNEEDERSVYVYDSAGRLSGITITLLESNAVEETTFNYVNDLLSSITSNDAEIPGAISTQTISRDSEGRIASVRRVTDTMSDNIIVSAETMNYLYDENGNISEMQRVGDDGNLISRDVFTYLATDESVFNLINLQLYYSP